MPDLRVHWSIDIEDCDDVVEAATEALDSIEREGSIARVFDVVDEHGMSTRVDFMDNSVSEKTWSPSNGDLADLADWMSKEQWDITEIVEMIRRPHKYADEYSKMIADRAFDVVAKEPEQLDEEELTD